MDEPSFRGVVKARYSRSSSLRASYLQNGLVLVAPLVLLRTEEKLNSYLAETATARQVLTFSDNG